MVGATLDVTRGDGPVDLAFAAGPGIRRLVSGEFAPDRAIATGVVGCCARAATSSTASRARSTWLLDRVKETKGRGNFPAGCAGSAGWEVSSYMEWAACVLTACDEVGPAGCSGAAVGRSRRPRRWSASLTG